MYVPLISRSPVRSSSIKTRFRRKGGGGGDRSGGGGSSSSGSSGGSSGGGSGRSGGGSTSGGGSRGGSSSGSRSPVPITRSSNTYTGGRNTATAYGVGGGKVTTIPAGQLFAGRSAGGGTRAQVFGSRYALSISILLQEKRADSRTYRTYGSGYPDLPNQRGVFNLGFPYYFWPIVWGLTTVEIADIAYLHDSEVCSSSLSQVWGTVLTDRYSQYGEPNNSSRPGNSLTTATFASNSTNTTFSLIADNSTTTALVTLLTSNCTSYLAMSSSSNFIPQPLDPSNPDSPKPEQAVQYYRVSSVVLTLDGYNNTAALSVTPGLPDTPLPSGVDLNLLSCLNQTIGAAVPLIDGAPCSLDPTRCMHLIGFFWILWVFKTSIY